jgi:hypothetical protein
MIISIIERDSFEIINFWCKIHLSKVEGESLKRYLWSISSVRSEYDEEIEKDVERTFPEDLTFSKGKTSYQKCFSVLRSISYHAPNLGYVQGFNFIVGTLIKLLPH